jgi:hypothetical protein
MLTVETGPSRLLVTTGSPRRAWPRGRVLYDRTALRFVVRADWQLDRPELMRLITIRIGINVSMATILSGRALVDYLHRFRARQTLSAIRAHLIALFEQSVVQSERLGSILKSRALHSATHASCVVSQRAAPTQAAQPPAGCAVTRHGDMHPANVRMRSATFTIPSGGAGERGTGGRAIRSCDANYGRT